MTLPNLEPVEVCPNCGDIVDALNEVTGWCFECSPPVCEQCKEHRTHEKHKLCVKCQREAWLLRNADQIELYISEGLSFGEAKAKALLENRAICIVCTQPIPGKHKESTLFCKKRLECRRVRKKFYKKVSNGVSEEAALEEALREGLAHA